MIGKILCKLGFHDEVPMFPPKQGSLGEEAYVECQRCNARYSVISVLSDHLSRSWERRGRAKYQ